MRVSVIGSGSQGNATLFEAGGARVLVDAGISVRALRKRLRELEIADTGFDALVITHSHADHVQHAARWAKHLEVPIYASAATRRDATALSSIRVEDIRPRGKIRLGGLTIHTVPLPHDAPQIAIIAESKEGERVALVTDLGHIPATLKHDLADCETVLLESNHCREQLAIAPYPPFLKRRIAGERGHLSNEQAAGLIRDLPDVRRLVLMHLSQKANSPRRARQVAMEALGGRNVELLIAKQDTPLVLPTLARPVHASEQETKQLALAF